LNADATIDAGCQKRTEMNGLAHHRTLEMPIGFGCSGARFRPHSFALHRQITSVQMWMQQQFITAASAQIKTHPAGNSKSDGDGHP